MTDSQVVTIDYLLSIINQKSLSIKDLAQKSGIEYTNLNAILNKKRVIGDKTIIKLSEALGIPYHELKNPEKYSMEHETYNYVSERENTYRADTVVLPDFTGENPQSEFLKKLEYLGEMGKMRDKGMLTEEEFIKIKNRIINLL
jgi:transcriptional regulator with XRE-family HTH domain